jgi:hypothetical protein
MSKDIYKPESTTEISQVEARRQNLFQRRELTDIIKTHVELAREYGSKNAEKYYMSISRLLKNKLKLPQKDESGKPIPRSKYTTEELMLATIAERIAANALEYGLQQVLNGDIDEKYIEAPYKQAYVRLKESIETFVHMYGVKQ